MKSFPALDFWPVNPTVSAETQIAPDLPGDRYASLTAYGARRPQNGGLTCDIDEGAVDQSEEFQSVGSIQDHLMITSRCCRPFLGTDEDVESLLFRVGECVRALKLNSGVTPRDLPSRHGERQCRIDADSQRIPEGVMQFEFPRCELEGSGLGWRHFLGKVVGSNLDQACRSANDYRTASLDDTAGHLTESGLGL